MFINADEDPERIHCKVDLRNIANKKELVIQLYAFYIKIYFEAIELIAKYSQFSHYHHDITAHLY